MKTVALNLSTHHARSRQFPNTNKHLSTQRKFTINTEKTANQRNSTTNSTMSANVIWNYNYFIFTADQKTRIGLDASVDST